MAQELDDGEFWLPSEFLTDEELLMDFKIESDVSGDSSGFNSDLSSPVESIMGSTETESDEDEFVTVLTQKLAVSAREHSCFSSVCKSKGWKLSGSPQSTLCMCRPGSSQGSPNCVSKVSSSPKDYVRDTNGIELLYEAAEEIARIRLIEELYSSKPFAPTPKPSLVKNPNTSPGFYLNQMSYLAKHRLMRENQMIETRFQNSGLSAGAWPTLQQSQQQKPGSGMRVVFLGENGIKKERTGTGVFLPRRIGPCSNNPTESRKKPGCSVLLPDRVVHALNLNLDSTEAHQINKKGHFAAAYEAAVQQRNNILMVQKQWRNLKPQQPLINNNQELGLPQEWSY